ncbi:MAG: hypothetical protein AAF431_04825 [Pseudomonadota bacterium]
MAIVLHRCRVAAGLLCCVWLLSGCASKPVSEAFSSADWVQEIMNYQYRLPADHPDQLSNLLVINDEMRAEVRSRFSHLSTHRGSEELAKWLISDDGHDMTYDIKASLPPIQAYNQRRGNCLSFTILLVSLAEEIGINIDYNAVDIPNTWGLDEELGMVSYRHVNGLLVRHGRRQVFDLAMNIYDSGYPQRVISREQALALLHNNKAVEFIRAGDLRRAVHPLKLAISLSPENPDLWVNFGVVMRRTGEIKKAGIAFEHALFLDKYNGSAATNLEVYYRDLGQHNKADRYKRQAEHSRKRNPYFYYQQAMEDYEQKSFRSALRSTKRAIQLHKDPRFYELQSLISQQTQDYRAALKSLKKAYTLSVGAEQRDRYANKAQMVYELALQNYEDRWEQERGIRALESLQRP